jgi:hypothetical protein
MQALKRWMAKASAPTLAGLGGKFLQSPPDGIKEPPRYSFTRLDGIPTVLEVEVSQKAVRSTKRKTHALRRA